MSAKAEDKKNLILRTAMQLFAAKGSAATSMQEIAEICGMSKGSLYLYFKSKEELEESLYSYSYQLLQEHLTLVERMPGLLPRDQLIQQIEVLLNLVLELREFLMMQLRDWITREVPPKQPEQVREHGIALLNHGREKLVKVYGPDILPYTADLFMQAQGMIGSYFRLLFNPKIGISTRKLAAHLVGLLDITAEYLLRERPEPLMTEEMLSLWSDEDSCHLQTKKRHPLLILRELKDMLMGAGLDSSQLEDAKESLQVLENEILELRPRRAIIQGMLGNLGGIPKLKPLLEELSGLMQPYLNRT